MISIYSKH